MPQVNLHIFRAGTHTSAEGARLTFTEADLDAIVASYDPAVHEAPLVLGHPKHDDPAYGWVRSLRRAGPDLEATVDFSDASFAEQVRTAYKKRSASFYLPDAPENPKPGTYYLRHLGLLGAQPPALKGLRPASFADGKRGFKTFAEGDAIATAAEGSSDAATDTAAAASTARFATGAAVRARGKNGKVTDERAGFYAVLFEGDTEPVRWLAEDELELGDPAATAGSTGAEVAAGVASHAETSLSARERELARREAQLRAETRRVRRLEIVSFCDATIREGRPLPMGRERTIAFLEALADAPATLVTASFGEGERRSLATIFREEYLARLPRQVVFAEVAPATLPADADPEQIAHAATAYLEERARAGVHVSSAEAVAHVRRR